jgi:AhpD family alkylhydroperoxidase
MSQRLVARHHSPESYQALVDFSSTVTNGGLEHSLVELVKIRASQINGCAFCLAMHTADARKLGETDERMLLLSVWRETPIYSARERAALAMTEALTLIAAMQNISDELYAEAAQHFNEKELVDLVLAIAAINSFNRLQITFRVPPVTEAEKVTT